MKTILTSIYTRLYIDRRRLHLLDFDNNILDLIENKVLDLNPKTRTIKYKMDDND